MRNIIYLNKNPEFPIYQHSAEAAMSLFNFSICQE